MNTATAIQPNAAAKPFGFGSKFKLLLRREFWENKGGFFWAPIVAGIIALAFTLLGAVTGSILFNKAKNEGHLNIASIQGNPDMGSAPMGFAGDISILTGVGLALIVMTFVVFFYALGSLYDERKDRSVLFWKSLPLSDTEVVLSKAAWALVLAPALAVAIGLCIGVGQWLLTALTMALNGLPGTSALFTESHPFRTLGQALGILPVYAMWALPTVGWLMLCSAWARSKPFLWAVLIPVLGAALISWMDTLPGLDIPHQKVWYVMLVRGLLSIVPMTWYANDSVNATHVMNFKGPEDLAHAIDFTSSWSAFATVDMWVGAAIGAAMIYAAIRLRRWRDEG